MPQAKRCSTSPSAWVQGQVVQEHLPHLPLMNPLPWAHAQLAESAEDLVQTQSFPTLVLRQEVWH